MRILEQRSEIGRLAWALRLYAGRLGWLGILGGVLIVASLISASVFLAPMRSELSAVQDNVQALRKSAAQRGDVKPRNDPAAQLAEFYQSFPGANSLPDTLQSIYAAATDNNIALSGGEYSLAEPESGSLQRYEIVLPVRAGYAQVRGLLAQVLAKNKNVALLSASLTRNASTDTGIDAQLRFAVYVHSAP